MSQRPKGRERGENTTSGSVHKRGDGLNLGGPVGSGPRPKGSSSGGSGVRAGGLGALGVIGALVFYLLGGGTGGTTGVTTPTTTTTNNYTTGSNGFFGQTQQVSYSDTTMNEIDTTVKEGVRDKFTKIIGNGKDEVTVLIYMCATDLESNTGAATADINEMAYATKSDKVNIILQTGGTKGWKNSVMNKSTAQRWRVTDKSLEPLDKKLGQLNMVEPETLTDFIKWGVKKYPADRYMLILWDHGGGSIQGYGYDQNYPNGSMTVDEISSALKKAGTKFDMIGFDACLMANVETAMAVSPYADYMIASEETEPGAGWYYTDWLSTLAKNTSTSTLELGAEICDTFVKDNNKKRSQLTSLSVVDLGEFSYAVPEKLKDFAKNLNTKITSDEYTTVSKARSNTKEYAQSNRLDMIDVVDFCNNINTTESKALAKAVKSCVKYNVVKNMKNSYGLSIYFPKYTLNNVNGASRIYEAIGMESEYTDSIRSYAQHAATGQTYTNSTTTSLFDILGGSQVSNNTTVDPSQLLNMLMGGGATSYNGNSLSSLFTGTSSSSSSSSTMDMINMFTQLVGRDHVSSDALMVTRENGKDVIALSESDWALINKIYLNVWVNDGEGYIDLGNDSIYDFDENGNLIMDYDNQWIAINGETIAYYETSAEYYDDDTYKITGYSPAMLNGERVNLIIEFTSENKNGSVLGAQMIYDTAVETKGLTEIVAGDQIDFLCDYYDADGNFKNNYYLSEPVKVTSDGLTLSTQVLEGVHGSFMYMLEDIYHSELHTPAIDF